MLLNQWMPTYDVVAAYQTQVKASPETTFDALLSVDFNRSWLIRALMGARGIGLSRRSHLRLEDMTDMGFILLEKAAPVEFVAGLVGKFWTLHGAIRQMPADEFKHFSDPGYAKVAWNFHLSRNDGGTALTTETRILCLDHSARKFFSRYWWFVGPFSGLMRKEMLRCIKRSAEDRRVVRNKDVK